jgi:hypothetical protein
MQELQNTNRELLKTKMSQALEDSMGMLSIGMQNILLDDLVTAFENRLKVLSHSKSNVELIVDLEDIKESKEMTV